MGKLMPDTLKKILTNIPNAKVRPDTTLTQDLCTLPPALPRDQRDSNTIQAYIMQKMRHYDMKKYTPPAHEYQRYTFDDHQIIYVRYYPEHEGFSTASQDKETASGIAIRKLSIIGGLLKGLESPDFLNIQDRSARTWLIQRLYQMAEEVENTPVSETVTQTIATFQGQLTQIIAASGVTDLSAEQIFKTFNAQEGAEGWFIGEYNSNKILCFETVIKDKPSEIQVDIPSIPLTDAQKKEFETINTESEPEWFASSRKRWEQDYLNQNKDKIIQKNPFKSSLMMRTPGIPNGRTNYFFLGDQLISRGCKTSTLNPFLIKDPLLSYRRKKTKERQRLTAQNAKQLLDHLTGLLKEESNSPKAQYLREKNIPPLVFVQSLVGHIGGESIMANEQENAIDNLSKDPSFKDFKIIAANSPINLTRHISWDWTKVNKIIEYTDTLLNLFNEEAPPEDTFDIEFIRALNDELKSMRQLGARFTQNIATHNFALDFASKAGVLVEALGGITSINCKSGKDRTGLEEHYHHTILLQWKTSKKLSRYRDLDTSDVRQQFGETFRRLFLTRKTRQLASENAPGADGIKDNGNQLLPADIRTPMQEKYHASYQLSKINKTKKSDVSLVLTTWQTGEKAGIRTLKPYEASRNFESGEAIRLTHHLPAHGIGFFHHPKTKTLDHLTVIQKINPSSHQLEHHFEDAHPIREMKSTQSDLLAALQVEAFLLASRHPERGIEIFGAVDSILSRKIEAYCEIKGIPCVNNSTLFHPRANREDCDNMKNTLTSKEAKALGLNDRPQTLSSSVINKDKAEAGAVLPKNTPRTP